MDDLQDSYNNTYRQLPTDIQKAVDFHVKRLGEDFAVLAANGKNDGLIAFAELSKTSPEAFRKDFTSGHINKDTVLTSVAQIALDRYEKEMAKGSLPVAFDVDVTKLSGEQLYTLNDVAAVVIKYAEIMHSAGRDESPQAAVLAKAAIEGKINPKLLEHVRMNVVASLASIPEVASLTSKLPQAYSIIDKSEHPKPSVGR